jgi:hypothetical protein
MVSALAIESATRLMLPHMRYCFRLHLSCRRVTPALAYDLASNVTCRSRPGSTSSFKVT